MYGKEYLEELEIQAAVQAADDALAEFDPHVRRAALHRLSPRKSSPVFRERDLLQDAAGLQLQNLNAMRAAQLRNVPSLWPFS